MSNPIHVAMMPAEPRTVIQSAAKPTCKFVHPDGHVCGQPAIRLVRTDHRRESVKEACGDHVDCFVNVEYPYPVYDLTQIRWPA